MVSILKNQKYQFIFSIILLAFGLLGIGLEILRAIESGNFLGTLFVTFLYFTTQSNLLITIIALLFIFKKTTLKSFDALAFIALINITITGAIFHIILIPYMSQVDLIQHVLHTVNPLIYVMFYFLFLNRNIPINKFYLGLIYPLVFLVLVYTFIEPIFGNYIESIVVDFTSARYIYPFLDPRNYEHETLGLIGFNLGLLAPIITVVSYILLFLKVKLSHIIH